MDPLEIIQKHYMPDAPVYEILITHSQLVAQKALWLAERVPQHRPDMQFIWEGAMLHDIGIMFTNAPKIFCHGSAHYIQHGIIGAKLLLEEGLPRHARVCERHTGVGITVDDIRRQNLPLPEKDYVPETLEEKVICLADKFYSKSPEKLRNERSIEKVRKSISKFGEAKLKILDEWLEFFGLI
jgi:uncharacterized protein